MTVAESCCVAPIDVKLKLVGETVTEVATGVGGVGGVVGELPPSPHAVSSKTAPNTWNLNFSVFLSPRYLMAKPCRNLGEHEVSDDQPDQGTDWCQSGQPQFGCNRAIYFPLQEQVPIEAYIRAAFKIGV